MGGSLGEFRMVRGGGDQRSGGPPPTVPSPRRCPMLSASGRGAAGSALALGARGPQFESGRPDQRVSQRSVLNSSSALALVLAGLGRGPRVQRQVLLCATVREASALSPRDPHRPGVASVPWSSPQARGSGQRRPRNAAGESTGGDTPSSSRFPAFFGVHILNRPGSRGRIGTSGIVSVVPLSAPARGAEP